ncbi:MAG: phenylalanine--tRNA ligase subunit beta [Promethearchaeota archaeon]
MPTIELKIDQLSHLLGKEVSYDTLQYDLQWISLDIDEYDPEEGTIKVEFNPNRPDFSSPEGVARLLKGYYGLEAGIQPYTIKEGKEYFEVNAKVRKVRPYVVSGLVRFDAPLNEEQVITLMRMQEILHWAVGRDRKKVAIGIHDYESVKGPYVYTTVKPDGIKFRPLHLEAYELTPQEILEEHPMGIQYAHLLEGFEEYPIIYDAEGKVVSLPPIINGTYTTVTPDKTKILLLDLTGTDERAVNVSLNILASTFADMGGELESVKVIYEDEPEKAKFTPDLTPNLWKARVDYINSYIGLNLSAKEMIACLRKMRLDATKLDKNTLEIQVPAYRDDIMHEVDLVEEVAMGYGYQNLTLTVNMEGFGKYHPVLQAAQKVREIMVGAGCLEMVNNILNSNNDNKKFLLKIKKSETILLANPVSSEYDTVRISILASLMKNVQFNRSEEKPFHLFEVGDVILYDKSKLTLSRRELHLGCVTHSDASDYSEIKGILDHFLRTFGILHEVSFKPVENPSYIPGRAADIYYKKLKIGTVGEIHPQVILNFGLDYPTAGFEINLMPFIQYEE